MRTVVRIYSPPGEDIDKTVVKTKQQMVFAVSAILFIAANVAVGLFPQPLIKLIESGIALL